MTPRTATARGKAEQADYAAVCANEDSTEVNIRVSHNTHFFELSYVLLTSHAFGFHGATKNFSAL